MSEEFRTINLLHVAESKLNPRKHYDEEKIKELADSIKSVGVIEPLVVRHANQWSITQSEVDDESWYLVNPKGVKIGLPMSEQEARQALAEKTNGQFELVAGSRRYRAAKLAGLAEIPAIVRELNDAQVLETMVIENNQREDVNPLEEAEGYKMLLGFKGPLASAYTLERLAEKVGRSTKYIYDRLKLLQLVPQAKKLLLENKITAGHAILLARLKPEQQKKALDPNNPGVWHPEHALELPWEWENKTVADLESHDRRKICSVRELEAWIDTHVRFEKKPGAIDAMLFPETEKTVAAALEEKEKIVQITHNHYTHPDAKEGNTERIYHSQSWKLADGSGTGKKKNKECEKSVTGVIVVGPERGKAYKVCVNKECTVHWPKPTKPKAQAQAKGESSWEKEQKKQQVEYERRERLRAAWEKAKPKILEACAEKLATHTERQLSEIAYRGFHGGTVKKAVELLRAHASKIEKDHLAILAMTQLCVESSGWNAWENFPKYARRIGVDTAAILKDQTNKQKVKGIKVKRAGKDYVLGQKIKSSDLLSKPSNKSNNSTSNGAAAKIHEMHGGMFKEPTCTECGCTEFNPCVYDMGETCSWQKLDKKTNVGLCSRCAEKLQTSAKSKKAKAEARA
ncbi:MAG TPA: ParB/RepB/Spo0J family partition protein [Candidatus Acidoferrales bacterium]|nr:ParB/RepB/Spo0J family partition protein [Candidatus Acidoferrales bacterium]